MPRWRNDEQNHHPLDERLQQVLMDIVKPVERDAVPLSPAQSVSFSEATYVHMQQKAHFKKGKWNRFPPEALANSE